uniref:Dynein heavy chain tail domain-containing protein n=1 Tax=Leptocylindrus danicus TaxID=163516 RepID=A0A7S2KYD7_9STRA|eukprot:CAMPEP_0116005804 /NCGR_PEP_ID=MMETSP0321-20121206/1368_1 /TAXON_ID=163516 /ORGANISM="Leptocylindrus danicus var. danicus, Strain B650" /LENGTH=798 /DNA_ID=CAMNT_0003474271 /DNA_START=436 /DNA_END=2832 /DNA_ORIENTATION=-
MKEVYFAREESNENAKLLEPLRKFFTEALFDKEDFISIGYTLRPILHYIFLLWKSSNYYRTVPRLMELMKIVCDIAFERIQKERVWCKWIVEKVSLDELDKVKVDMVQILMAIGAFKSTFLQYKKRVSNECPDRSWNISNEVLFCDLDALLGRCHEIIYIIEVSISYRSLYRLVFPTHTRQSTTFMAELKQILIEFENLLADTLGTKKHNRYDIMSNTSDMNIMFAQCIAQFQNYIASLDERVGILIFEGFCKGSLGNQLLLFQNFGGVLLRPLVAKHLTEVREYMMLSLLNFVRSSYDAFHLNRCDSIGNGLVVPYSVRKVAIWQSAVLQKVTLYVTIMKVIDNTLTSYVETKKKLVNLHNRFVSDVSKSKLAQQASWEKHAVNAKTLNDSQLKHYSICQGPNNSFQFLIGERLLDTYNTMKNLINANGKENVSTLSLQLYDNLHEMLRNSQMMTTLVSLQNHTVALAKVSLERDLIQISLKAAERAMDLASDSSGCFPRTLVLSLHERIYNNFCNLKRLEKVTGEIYLLVERWRTDYLDLAGFEELDLEDVGKSFGAKCKYFFELIRQSGLKALNLMHENINFICEDLIVSTEAHRYIERVQRVIIDGLVHSSSKILQNLITALFEPNSQTIQLIVYIPIERQIPLRKILFDCISLVFSLGQILPRFDGLDGSYVGELKSAPQLLHKISKLYMQVERLESKYCHTCFLFSKFQHLLLSPANNMTKHRFQHKISDFEDKSDEATLDNAEVEDQSLIQHQIDKITGVINVGCFRIDARPLKTVLGISLGERKCFTTGT